GGASYSGLQWGRRVHSAKRAAPPRPAAAPPRASMGSPSSLGEESGGRTGRPGGPLALQWGRRVHSAKSSRIGEHSTARLHAASMGSPSSLGEEGFGREQSSSRRLCFNGVAEFTRRRARLLREKLLTLERFNGVAEFTRRRES